MNPLLLLKKKNLGSYFTLALCLGLFHVQSQIPPSLDNGKLDLRNWDTERHPVILLNDQWKFYWNELIQWKDINKNDTVTFALLSVPWNEQLINGRELPAKGFATYALEIIPPAGMDSLALEVPAVFNSHALYVNNKLVCHNGKVATNKEEMKPQWKPQTIVIPAQDTLRVIFQIANFQSMRGGCAESFRLGVVQKLKSYEKISRTSITILILLFLFVGLVGLTLYFKEKRKAMLYYSCLSFAFALRFLFSDLYPYYTLLGSIPWEIAARIEYASVPIIVIWGILLISTLYPLEFKNTTKTFFLISQAIVLIAVLILPHDYFSTLLSFIQILSLSFLIYIIYVIGKALLSERIGAWTSITGLAIFAFTGIYNLFVFWYLLELNRIFILLGYTTALVLNGISLLYRTSTRINKESNVLRYSDLYNTDLD